MKNMKIFIAVPCMDQVPARFAQSLAMLKKVGECAVGFQIGSLIYTSRNDLASKAIELDADFVLWLDSDMVFNPDLLEKMMDHFKDPEVDFVTGVYYRRVSPFTPVIFKKLDQTKPDIWDWSGYDDFPEKLPLFPVEGCGFGCVLMRTDVLMSVQGKFGNMFAPIGNVGEDLAFCWRARQCGFKIFCDPAIPLGHVGHNIVNGEFFKAYKESSKKDK